MKFQLVIQFPERIMDFERMVELEESMIKALQGEAQIDGHDIGSGEINFFLFTDDPEGTFKRVTGLLDDKMMKVLKVAYRDVAGQEYVILWSKGLRKFRVK